MIKKLIKNLFILKVLAILQFFIANAAFSDSLSSIPNISQRLWYKLSNSDNLYLKQINSYIDKKDFDSAANLCSKFVKEFKKEDDAKRYSSFSKDSSFGVIVAKKDFSEAVCDLVDWHRYSDSQNLENISFADISSFAIDNQYLYNIEDIKKNVEHIVVESDVSYEEVVHYFALNPPMTKDAKLHLLRSKIAFFNKGILSENQLLKINQDIDEDIKKIWVEEDLDEEEEIEFLANYSNSLQEKDHIARIERLLIENKRSAASRIFGLVNNSYRRLFIAVSKINSSRRYINNYILSVPRSLRSNEALLYKRALWYKSKDRPDDVVEILLRLPKNAKFRDKWWRLKRLYTRELIKQKDFKRAYNIVSKHGLPKNHPKYWEAQWTSGWIALRFIDRPKDAYNHFLNLYNNVVQPVSIARASYWLGLSMETMNKFNKARYWYKKAAGYPIYFYGQLAINKYKKLNSLQDLQIDISLPKAPEITSEDLLEISNSKPIQIAYILLKQGKRSKATKMLEKLILNSSSRGEVAIIMKIVNEFSDQALEVKLARQAAKKNVFFISDSFQVLKQIKNKPNAPLIHAIIRQESGFAREAVSSAGAIGFMQVMPGTAKLVARDLGIRYNKRKLSQDINYNIKIGSHYIKTLVDKFDGSEILAIAAYNAGPNNALRWIDEFYDPREVGNDIDKVVDWIELITYYETRNYVQRIMENIIIYKYLLAR